MSDPTDQSEAIQKAKGLELAEITERDVRARQAAVPFALSELAFRRTEPLALQVVWRPVRNVAADAYLQGLRDAAQVAKMREKAPKE